MQVSYIVPGTNSPSSQIEVQYYDLRVVYTGVPTFAVLLNAECTSVLSGTILDIEGDPTT